MFAKEFFGDGAELVECGRIGRPIGLRGESVVFWNSDDCPVSVGDELFIAESKKKYERCRVAALREHGRSFIMRLEGIDSREDAAEVTNRSLYIPEDRLPDLPDGEYYSYQILGIEVVTEEGRSIGRVVKIFTVGENDVYEILPEGAKRGDEILIPVIEDVVIKIDLGEGRITIRPMEGMLD